MISAVRLLFTGLRGLSDALFAFCVLASVVLLVAPITPAFLDVCLALNLGLAAIILTITLTARHALRFASFPTLLLLTTLMRLALNVSSTRLVLSHGEAGRIVQAFGQVVVQGNYVVGGVIFAIVTLVQLLVVAKGAERVAEVTARFTLDALPGKQMSIDADLRSGTIDQAEASKRRRTLERESQLYGAMDGALKFVKGDAIAGIAIVLVNVIGGLATGLTRGMALEVALRRYVLLAIGDGLASQLPALLIAIAAGVAVTRVASEEDEESLGSQVLRQLSAEPRSLWAVSALLGCLSLIPGLPGLPFVLLGGAVGGAAYWLTHRRSGPMARSPALELPDQPFSPEPPIVLELSPEFAAYVHQESPHFLSDALPALRHHLWRDLGLCLPELVLRTAPLPTGDWRLLIEGAEAAGGSIPLDRVEVLIAPEELSWVRIPCRVELEPFTGRRTAIVTLEDAPRANALAPVRGPLARLLASVAATLRSQGYRLIGVQEIQRLLDGLELSAPALVREVGRQLPPALIAETLRRLLEEEVSIQPLRVILDTMLACGPSGGSVMLGESCRRALARQIAGRWASNGWLTALALDPGTELSVREALEGDRTILEPEMAANLLDDLEDELRRAAYPRVLLAGADVRRAVRALVANRFPRLPVLSYEELPRELPVRLLGKVGLAAQGRLESALRQ